ncbi:putative long-chain-fatty-acid--CoA ligase 5 [Apostichopus japonicus]|uniref:Long-chain-fatty-acid--CoA ligase n=1 Tax=Stichopus japonicus TaxID=307972 RepID=A0A2G8K929_STIJA|nr:putative long-chain-fatty-acid--CoA ligase 5 [Apostichopus japonicus]
MQSHPTSWVRWSQTVKHLIRHRINPVIGCPRLHSTLIDPNQQSVQLPGPERIRVTSLPKELIKHSWYPDVHTMYDAVQQGLRKSNDGPCLGKRPGGEGEFQWKSYSESIQEAEALGSGLINLGISPGQESRIGIYARNTVEWLLCDIMCFSFNFISVPLYDTLGWKAVVHAVNSTAMTTIFCDDLAKAKNLLKHSSDMPTLQTVIVTGYTPNDQMGKEFLKGGLNIFSFEEVMDRGKRNLHPAVPPKPDDISTICFTSGTTGIPKGVMLKHRNFIANHAYFFNSLEPVYRDNIMSPSAVHFSYLPLPHVFERCNTGTFLTSGGSIGVYSGDLQKLLEDIATLRPTYFPVVPRVANRFVDGINTKVNQGGALKKAIFNYALKAKHSMLERGIVTRKSFWDKLVFNKVQDQFGGRLTAVFSGGAPIAPEVIMYLRAVLGIYVAECYGQTETTCCITHSLVQDPTAGHVGPVNPGLEMKLRDVPEMKYFAEQDQGEVCVRGGNIFDGYWQDEEKTKETKDADGWLATGDIGRWLPNGALQLIDRRKHIFKLSQGEFIAPEKIENIYARNRFVMQNFVYGSYFQSSLVGVIVPNPDEIPALASELKLEGTLAELCERKELKKAFLDQLLQFGKEEGLQGFEQVKDIILVSEPFSQENNLLTPTLKNKRPQLTEEFQDDIDKMYEDLNEC